MKLIDEIINSETPEEIKSKYQEIIEGTDEILSNHINELIRDKISSLKDENKKKLINEIIIEEEFKQFEYSFIDELLNCNDMKEFENKFVVLIQNEDNFYYFNKTQLEAKKDICILLMETIEQKIELFEHIQEFIINQPENKPE